ncbi:MAG: hypothetical protein HWN66_05410 [Candidatus Helarchaeota archaeon]|nr:hypothetical protein [Candidatus Helarchaeota archaeon]
MHTLPQRYIGKFLRELVKADIGIITFSLKDSSNPSYGLQVNAGSYIPLPLGASRFLDLLKSYWEKTGKSKFTLKELSKVAEKDVNQTRNAFSNYYKALIDRRLIEITKGRPLRLKLTDKCINYFNWNDNSGFSLK